tara:strand:+ start:280 stop:870 length:591 start_codon:yes stop_codon:yes gene_type:complete
MTTATSPLSRQPTVTDYSSPTQFRFGINQLPKVEFFTTSANLPGISLGELVIPTPYTDIPIVGDKITYENLSISFIVDEFLENYISIHNWLIGIGFPSDRQQFTTFRSTTSNTSIAGGGGNTDIGKVGKTTADRPLYSDATLTILSNKNNPIVEVRYSDMFPVSLSGLDYNSQEADVDYLTATIDFRYKLYEIVTL